MKKNQGFVDGKKYDMTCFMLRYTFSMVYQSWIMLGQSYCEMIPVKWYQTQYLFHSSCYLVNNMRAAKRVENEFKKFYDGANDGLQITVLISLQNWLHLKLYCLWNFIDCRYKPLENGKLDLMEPLELYMREKFLHYECVLAMNILSIHHKLYFWIQSQFILIFIRMDIFAWIY